MNKQQASELRAHNGKARTTVEPGKAASRSDSFSVRKAKQRILCHPKMIMSYLAKIEMSYDPGEPL